MWVPVAVRRVANCYTPFTLLYFFYGLESIACAVPAWSARDWPACTWCACNDDRTFPGVVCSSESFLSCVVFDCLVNVRAETFHGTLILWSRRISFCTVWCPGLSIRIGRRVVDHHTASRLNDITAVCINFKISNSKFTAKFLYFCSLYFSFKDTFTIYILSK